MSAYDVGFRAVSAVRRITRRVPFVDRAFKAVAYAAARRILRFCLDRSHMCFDAMSVEDRDRTVQMIYHAFRTRSDVVDAIVNMRDLLGDRATERDRDLLARLGEVADAHRGAVN